MKSKRLSNIILPFARKYLPNIIRDIYCQYKHEKNNEIHEILSFLLKNGPISGIPYGWTLESNYENISINYNNNHHPYVLLGNKKLYYPVSWTEDEIKKSFHALLIEQDKRSPHRYLTDDFTINPGDVVVDCGAAEGIFALENIEKIKSLYLFEPEKIWFEPLCETYEPYIKEGKKVYVITKYLSDKTSDESTTLDDFFKDKEPPSLIKMDVEGFEATIIKGGDKLLSFGNVPKIVTCVYHHANDERDLSNLLQNYGYNISVSSGWTILSLDTVNGRLQPPYLRHGVIRCTKNITCK